jgi:putative SOS response-associated peptidase YedK
MCYDIAYLITLESVEEYFGNKIVIDEPRIETDFDVSVHVLAQAHKKGLIVLQEGDNYRGKFFEWGVIANYMDTPDKIRKMRSSMCNIRSEKILDKKSYWYRIRENRCLVPIKGFYEHRAIKGWKSKVPYYVELKNRDMFCLPGLYAYSPVPNIETGELIGTYAPITREANSIMKQIHNDGDNAFRMPLMLPKELEMKWLQPDLTDAEIQEILSYEMPAEELNYHAVWTIRTTKPHPNKGKKTDPFNWPNLPPLGQDDGELQKTLF